MEAPLNRAAAPQRTHPPASPPAPPAARRDCHTAAAVVAAAAAAAAPPYRLPPAPLAPPARNTKMHHGLTWPLDAAGHPAAKAINATGCSAARYLLCSPAAVEVTQAIDVHGPRPPAGTPPGIVCDRRAGTRSPTARCWAGTHPSQPGGQSQGQGSGGHLQELTTAAGSARAGCWLPLAAHAHCSPHASIPLMQPTPCIPLPPSTP